MAGKASSQMNALCDTFVVPEYHDRVKKFFDLKTLPERMTHEETIAIECPANDGNWHLARFIAKNRDKDGTVTNVLYVTQLISDEKRREQFWIVAAEEANQANAAKSAFLSRMSHDIRTPMNVIMGIPIIALTANAYREDVGVCVAAGMNDHLAKPLDMDRTLRVIAWYRKNEA